MADEQSDQRDPDTMFRAIVIVMIVVATLIVLPLLTLLLGFLGFRSHGRDPL